MQPTLAFDFGDRGWSNDTHCAPFSLAAVSTKDAALAWLISTFLNAYQLWFLTDRKTLAERYVLSSPTLTLHYWPLTLRCSPALTRLGCITKTSKLVEPNLARCKHNATQRYLDAHAFPDLAWLTAPPFAPLKDILDNSSIRTQPGHVPPGPRRRPTPDPGPRYRHG